MSVFNLVFLIAVVLQIGACLSHQIADGLSFLTFLYCWAGIAREEKPVPVPNPQFIISAKLFPSKNIYGFDPRSGITKENLVWKMFVFDAYAVENLRERYTSFENDRPTRVEALSAFIWSRYVVVAVTRDKNKTHVVIHAVNLRP
uniref:Vinorine synthase n=1 Tax=Cajanus cajan TaxID=3821 RepID=A0A151SGB0_CAJCA|nr:Vinorine synthase [Cajanus cajan]